jgi:hypothetical protein
VNSTAVLSRTYRFEPKRYPSTAYLPGVSNNIPIDVIYASEFEYIFSSSLERYPVTSHDVQYNAT